MCATLRIGFAHSNFVRCPLLDVGSLESLSWTSLASDPKADVIRARLPDAREVSYAIDRAADLLWIKVSLFEPAPDAKVAVAEDRRALLLGIPRSTLGGASTARILATVGSMIANNDDVPNEGMVTIKLER